MAYNYEYPYVDPNRYNDDWLINETKNLLNEWEKYKDYIDNYFKNLDVHAEIENIINQMYADGRLEQIISKYKYQAFVNKKIVILGDSISEPTSPASWTVRFKEIVESVGGTVVNLSIGGLSFMTAKNQIMSGQIVIPADGDIYILALGINDFLLQGLWIGDDSLNPIQTATRVVMSHIVDKSGGDKRYVYISPIKYFGNLQEQGRNPLQMHRIFYERYAAYYGYEILSGYNIPVFSALNHSKSYIDGLHPTIPYARLMGQYIAEAVTNRCSDITSTTVTRFVLNSSNTQNTILYYMPDNTISINCYTNQAFRNGDVVDFGQLPTCFGACFPYAISTGYPIGYIEISQSDYHIYWHIMEDVPERAKSVYINSIFQYGELFANV